MSGYRPSSVDGDERVERNFILLARINNSTFIHSFIHSMSIPLLRSHYSSNATKKSFFFASILRPHPRCFSTTVNKTKSPSTNDLSYFKVSTPRCSFYLIGNPYMGTDATIEQINKLYSTINPSMYRCKSPWSWLFSSTAVRSTL